MLGQIFLRARSWQRHFLNNLGHDTKTWWITAFVVSFTLNLIAGFALRGFNRPDPPGDSQDYVNIAINLYEGFGFGNYPDNPNWRRLYETNNADGTFDAHLASHGEFQPSAYRPPLVPFLMAIVYAVSGDYFFIAWRIADSVIVATAIAIGVSMIFQRIGPLAAGILLFFCCFDPLRYYDAPRVMTEGTAMLLVMIVVWLCVDLVAQRQRRRLAGLAVAMGLMVLCRSIFVLWMPLLLLIVTWIYWNTERTLWSTMKQMSLFVVVSVLVFAPWGVRNCLLTKQFMPLGTQGGIALPGGYSDIAVAAKGSWRKEAFENMWTTHGNNTKSGSDIKNEVAMSAAGMNAAQEWAHSNWKSLPRLAVRKIVTEWTTRMLPALRLVPLIALGAIAGWRGRGHWLLVPFALLAINQATIAITYASGGRFLIPTLIPMYMLASVGVVTAIQWLASLSPKVAGGAHGAVPVEQGLQKDAQAICTSTHYC